MTDTENPRTVFVLRDALAALMAQANNTPSPTGAMLRAAELIMAEYTVERREPETVTFRVFDAKAAATAAKVRTLAEPLIAARGWRLDAVEWESLRVTRAEGAIGSRARLSWRCVECSGADLQHTMYVEGPDAEALLRTAGA